MLEYGNFSKYLTPNFNDISFYIKTNFEKKGLKCILLISRGRFCSERETIVSSPVRPPSVLPCFDTFEHESVRPISR